MDIGIACTNFDEGQFCHVWIGRHSVQQGDKVRYREALVANINMMNRLLLLLLLLCLLLWHVRRCRGGTIIVILVMMVVIIANRFE